MLTSFTNDLHVAVIGASGGIGQALITRLLQCEKVALVTGFSRRPKAVDADQDSRYQQLQLDYSDEETIKNAAAELTHPLDIVIVATGLLHDDGLRPERTYRHVDVESMNKNFLVNTIGPTLLAKHFLPHMRKQQKAVFTALSARVGSISDNRLGGWYAYRASKSALNMLIKTLSIEITRSQPQWIIAGLHPGTVDTALSKPFQRQVAPEKLFTPEFSAQCLLNVIDQMTPEDSGSCFAWDGQRIPE